MQSGLLRVPLARKPSQALLDQGMALAEEEALIQPCARCVEEPSARCRQCSSCACSDRAHSLLCVADWLLKMSAQQASCRLRPATTAKILDLRADHADGGREEVCHRPSEPPAHAARTRHAHSRWVLGPAAASAQQPCKKCAHLASSAREQREQPRPAVAHRAAPSTSPRASPSARPRCSPYACLVQASMVGDPRPPPPLPSSSSSSSSSRC